MTLKDQGIEAEDIIYILMDDLKGWRRLYREEDDQPLKNYYKERIQHNLHSLNLIKEMFGIKIFKDYE